MKIKTLVEKVNEVSDPRRQWGNKRHPLAAILVIGFCTIVCGGEDFTDMESFGIEREEWLGTFLPLPNGIPDSETFRRVFEKVNPQELSEILRDFLGFHRKKRSIISVDGKTMCGSAGESHQAGGT